MNTNRDTTAGEGQWLAPYRTMDASGSPESAGEVGWNWLSEMAQRERAADAVLLEIHTSPIDADGKSGVLYRSTKPIAAYFVVRDQMNFALLFRWHTALRQQATDRESIRGEAFREAAAIVHRAGHEGLATELRCISTGGDK